MVDIKFLYCFIYFNKEIKVAIVWLVHRSPRVLHHVCLQPQSYTFGVYSKLTNSIGSCPPPPQTGLLHRMSTILAK